MKGDFVDCLRGTLLIGKYLGLIPLTGLRKKENIPRFNMKSFYMLIYVTILIMSTFIFVIQIYVIVHSQFAVFRLSSIIFYGVFLILLLNFLRFCLRCEHFVKSVIALEKLLPPMKKPRSVLKNIKIIMAANIIMGFAEEVAFHIFSAHMTYHCYLLPEDSGLYLKSYIMVVVGWFFQIFQFSYASATIVQIMSIQAGFMWVYSNMFVMVTCIYLKHRLEDFNNLIINKYSMFTNNFKPTWSELQVHYTRISQLVTLVDDHINAIVFISYASNLYYICLEVYYILNELADPNAIQNPDCQEQHSYDAISILFALFHAGPLLARTSLISYLASEVNVASRMPLRALYTIPPSANNEDMRRLMTQVYYSKVGLTGLNFFRITRGMIIAMIAQLLTYELVLVQF